VSERDTYGKGGGTSTVVKAAGISLAIVGVLLAPVIAIVGGTALVAALSGHGGKQ
jgi:hypothetical protein